MNRVQVVAGTLLLTLVALAGLWGLNQSRGSNWFGGSETEPTVYALAAPVANTERTAEQRDKISNGMAGLRDLLNQEQTAGIFQAIPLYKKRARLAGDLLQHPLTDGERQYILLSRMDALVRLLQTRDLRSREQLLSLLAQITNDPDPAVRKQARIAEATRRVIDFVRLENSTSEFARTCLSNLVRDYPEDREVLIFCRNICAQLIREDQVSMAAEMLYQFEELYSQSSNPEFRDFAAQIPDLVRIAQVRYDVALEEMHMSQPDFERFLGIVEDLAAGPMGEELLRTLIRAGLKCERHGKIAEARRVFEKLDARLGGDLGATLTLESIADFRQLVQASLRRIDSVGDEVRLHGRTRDGLAVSPERTRGKQTLVVFWSLSAVSRNPQYLPALDQALMQVQSESVQVVGYCLDSCDEDTIRQSTGFCPVWLANSPDDKAATQELTQILGVPLSPYIILLDSQNRIRAINLDPNELERHVAR